MLSFRVDAVTSLPHSSLNSIKENLWSSAGTILSMMLETITDEANGFVYCIMGLAPFN